MKRVLFVDDEPRVLRGLERMLCEMAGEWEMAFAGGGDEALALLAQEPFDVVVSDMRMPGMNGAQLLAEIRREYPETVRIVLSGHSDREMILQSLGSTHQYLAKPCEFEQLHNVVARACSLRRLLGQENLRLLVSRTQTLPSLPRLYTAVMAEIQSPNGSVKRVAELISQDIAMTAKILQIVNSAFFGLPRKVSDPSQAVTLLGLDSIRALILAAHVFSLPDEACLGHPHLDDLWNHSLSVGVWAKRIACAEMCDPLTCDHALIAGLLHDTGMLIMAFSLRDGYREMLTLARRKSLTLAEAETAVFGSTHADVGAYLIGLWGLPDPIVEAIAFHHQPDRCVAAGFTPLTAVHVADALNDGHKSPYWGTGTSRVDSVYLDRLGLADRLAGWHGLGCPRTPEGVHP